MTNRNLILLVFGDTVRTRRLQLGLTQEMLSKKARLHRTYLADIEAGRRNLSLNNIVQLARALGVTPSDLLEGLR